MKKEEKLMERIMNKFDEFQIPPHIQKEFGLKKNWKKEISPKVAEIVLNNANKFQKALRKLSKN